MRNSPKQYARALFELVEAHPNKAKENISKFTQVLKKRHTLSLVPKISSELEKIEKHNSPIRSLESADEHSLKLAEKATGFEGKVNSKLIAGITLTMKDTRIDTTISRRLEQLESIK